MLPQTITIASATGMMGEDLSNHFELVLASDRLGIAAGSGRDRM
jgi:hypothetical protein